MGIFVRTSHGPLQVMVARYDAMVCFVSVRVATESDRKIDFSQRVSWSWHVLRVVGSVWRQSRAPGAQCGQSRASEMDSLSTVAGAVAAGRSAAILGIPNKDS